MTSDIRIVPLGIEGLDEAWQISLEAFADDTHTLFKMHEKGSTDLGSELLPKEFLAAYLNNPAKMKVWQALLDGRVVGYTIWGLYNWQGQNRNVGLGYRLTVH